MLLKNSHKNEFNQIEGRTFFPYFNKEITVIYQEGISPEVVIFGMNAIALKRKKT